MSGDNEGRRMKVRDLLSHDPFYRRIKDAVMVILAILVSVGWLTGQNPPDVLAQFLGKAKPVSTSDGARELWRTRLETRMDGMDKKMDRLEDKIDRLLVARWR